MFIGAVSKLKPSPKPAEPDDADAPSQPLSIPTRGEAIQVGFDDDLEGFDDNSLWAILDEDEEERLE